MNYGYASLPHTRWATLTEQAGIKQTKDVDKSGPYHRLGLQSGQVIQVFGWDEDVDDELDRELREHAEVVDDDYSDVVDAVVIWYRDDDGDLADELLDALSLLVDGGVIWLLTPKSGRDGHVDGEEIAEAAPVAGLVSTGVVSVNRMWQGTRLSTPKRRK